MASIHKQANGRKAIQIVCPDKKRRTIRLGKATMGVAKEAKRHIEAIGAAKWSGVSLPLEQVNWLNQLGDEIYERIAKVGIVEPRINAISDKPRELHAFATNYIDGRIDLKKATKDKYRQTRRFLCEFLGRDRPVGEITRADAKAWQRWLSAYVIKEDSDGNPIKIMAPATVSKHTKRAKTMFTEAVDARLIKENPMDAIKGGKEVNRDRDHFVDSHTAQTILDGCSDVVWRLIFAMARYAGMRRCELLAINWADILWDESKLRIDSPKTGLRFCPVFPELLPHLEAAFDQADIGQVRCVERYTQTANLGTQMNRVIEAAGVLPWEKTFQNLRASRRTELEEQFPTHVVNAWMGHSTRVARESYLQVTPEHWTTAVLITQDQEAQPIEAQ